MGNGVIEAVIGPLMCSSRQRGFSHFRRKNSHAPIPTLHPYYHHSSLYRFRLTLHPPSSHPISLLLLHLRHAHTSSRLGNGTSYLERLACAYQLVFCRVFAFTGAAVLGFFASGKLPHRNNVVDSRVISPVLITIGVSGSNAYDAIMHVDKERICSSAMFMYSVRQ